MKKIKQNIYLFLFVFLITIAGLNVSCEDNSKNSGKVELLSFGPSGAQLGDTISFIGNNLDKVIEIVFVGDNVPQSKFVSQSSQLIRAIIPPNAQRGYVTLRNSDGTSITSLTMIDFLVPVEIATIGPVPVKPGTDLTITGTHMDWISDVVFFNNAGNITVVDTFFVSQSATQIVVSVPMAAQTGLFTIHTAGTKPLAITLQPDLQITLPVITSFSPNPVFGGKEQLTIVGTDLDLVAGILLNGPGIDTIKTFISHTPTEIVIAPPATTAPGPITLIPYSLVPVFSSTPLNVVLPSITDLQPNPVDRGSQVTIIGTNLDLVTGVILKGVPDTIKSFLSQSSTQLILTVPQSAEYGAVTVVSPPLVPITSTDALSYVGDPVQLPPLGAAIYDEGYQNGFSYGWWLSIIPDPSSTDVVPIGKTESLKMTFDGGWSGAFYQNGNISLSSYSTFQFSVYGGSGTDGEEIQFDFNGGSDNIAFTVAEGKWTDFSMPISTWTSLSSGSATTMQIQDKGWAGSGTVYFYRIGFK